MGKVHIETVMQHTGWAVYTGCEGEDPTFVAYFAERAMAELYVKACQQDSDAEWWLGCEGDVQIVPAATEAEILTANHFSDLEGMAALAAQAEIAPYDVEQWRKELQGGSIR